MTEADDDGDGGRGEPVPRMTERGSTMSNAPRKPGTDRGSGPGPSVCRAFRRLPDLIEGDEGWAFRARGMTLDVMLASGRDRFYVPVRAGRVGPVAEGSQILRSASLAFAAKPETWLAHWRPVPAPGEHDLLALVKDERMTIEGDMTLLMRHLQNLKDLLAAPRALSGAARTTPGSSSP